MRIVKISSVAIAIIIAAAALSGSENENPDVNAPFLVRLAYEDNGVAGNVPRNAVCMAIWQEGQYRILRNGDFVGPRLVQGSMSDAELKQLLSVLDSADFRNLSSARGDFVNRQFIAEVRHGEGVQHVVLVIPGRDEVFPKAAADMIHWLLTFKPQNAESLANSDSRNVCPLPNLSPYVPVTASR